MRRAINARCERCWAGIKWVGVWMEHPPCPRCKYRPSVTELRGIEEAIGESELRVLLEIEDDLKNKREVV